MLVCRLKLSNGELADGKQEQTINIRLLISCLLRGKKKKTENLLICKGEELMCEVKPCIDIAPSVFSW